MRKFLNGLLEGNFIVDLLTTAALFIFVLSVILALAPAVRIIGAHPITAILSVIITIIKSLYQPAILLGLAKLIALKQRA